MCCAHPKYKAIVCILFLLIFLALHLLIFTVCRFFGSIMTSSRKLFSGCSSNSLTSLPLQLIQPHSRVLPLISTKNVSSSFSASKSQPLFFPGTMSYPLSTRYFFADSMPALRRPFSSFHSPECVQLFPKNHNISYDI